jgi:hypothetical protein
VEIDVRRLVTVFVVLCILALAAMVAVTAVSAADENSRNSELRHDGVRVVATVTGCEAVGSGVGQGTSYYSCRAGYSLDGHTYNEVLGGTRAAYQPGQSVPAVAVPRDPGALSTAASLNRTRSSFTPFITPILLGVLTLAMIAGLVVWPKRPTPRRPPVGAPDPAAGG